VEDVVNKGDAVTAKVIKLDPEHKKIALSIKEHLIDENQCNRDDIVVTSAQDEQEAANGDDEQPVS
jgi:small subunit ribosomal protein S1